MVASVGRITAGRGYDYLTRDVATSKHDYYTGNGEAPGRWAGAGSALLGLSGEVDADDMAALYGRFVVPSTAGGTRLPSGRWEHEQVLGRKVVAKPRADGTIAEPAAAFDVTFSPSKSVSLLWGLTSDDRVRDSVVAAHEAAVATALEYLTETAGHTRAGDGGIRKVAGNGLVIAQFRHRTARSTAPSERVGDPQLHSHCAVLNRVQGADGVWRTLDSRALYRHAHAAGAIYGATLERLLSERLGVSWIEPDRRVPMREIAGIPAELIQQFSSRRAAVLAGYESLEEQWRTVHGRSPTRDERAGMMDEATLRSRQTKCGGDVDLHEQWRRVVPAAQLVRLDNISLLEPQLPPTTDRLDAGSRELSERVFVALHEQRSWWTRAHVTAEVARLIAEPTLESIELETERIIASSVALEPDHDPEYADLSAAKYTSDTIQQAETRVIDAASVEPAPFTVKTVRDPALGDDQVAAVDAITSGHTRVTTIVGPAGAGKTTMLRSVAASFEAADHGVLVLALSAAAARVVTEETGLPASTVASWRVGNVDMPRNGLVIIDEASMIPTLTLDDITRVANIYGSRVALIGDYAQMSAPEAGGLIRDLAILPTAIELTTVRRFTEQWEADATLLLRARQPDVAATYERHDRIRAAAADSVVRTAAAAWWADTEAGASTVVVVDTAADAATLNSECQQYLIVAGRLGRHVADTRDGCRIHIGDQLQTRRNTREIVTTDHQRILNRDVWTVTGRHDDGALTVRHAIRGATAVLPADYVTNDTVLAYATTIAGAQGRTVDRGHVVVTPRTNSASLYVGMSRGRRHNTAHVVCDGHDHDEFEPGDRTPRDALAAAITRDPEGQLSARTIAQRWSADGAGRQRSRDADRRRQDVAAWWNTRHQSLPSRMQTALADHHGHLLDILADFPTTREREQALAAAASTIDWRDVDANSTFVNRLRHHVARVPLVERSSAASRRGLETSR